jgi:outer membrane protein assembly factor BamB
VSWSVTLPAAVTASPVVAGGAVYAGTTGGSLYSLSISTGTENWNGAIGGSITAAPAFIQGDIAVGSSAGVVSYLVASSGDLRYRVREMGAPSVAGIAGAGNFLVATDSNGNIQGSKPGPTDPKAWLTAQGTSLAAAPTVVNGEVLVPGLDDTLAVYTVPGRSVF